MATQKKYFGTDGIRGKAGEGKLSPESITRLGFALGKYLAASGGNPKVLIGRDTRESGHWIEKSVTEALQAYGARIELLNVLPTAAVSFLTAKENADLGMMITASHNPHWDNGIKLFGSDGTKLSDDAQLEIEDLLGQDVDVPEKTTGTVTQRSDLTKAYLDKLVETIGDNDLSNLSVVLDCANGASFETGPAILKALGIENVSIIGASPDGTNINRGFGSTHPEKMCQAVQDHGADIGIAMDGDADRLIMCDEKGAVIDGDQMMGALTLAWRDQGRLKKPVLVTTLMSNLGLERLIAAEGIEFIRTAVGDRYVAAAMQEHDYNLGGEQSGHMLMPDYLPTGDGMLAAIQVLSVLAASGRPASQSLRVFDPVPQLLVNVRYEGQSPLDNPVVTAAIEQAQSDFEGQGRILIRASGTEPLIRVMAEGDDPDQVHAVVHGLAEIIQKA